MQKETRGKNAAKARLERAIILALEEDVDVDAYFADRQDRRELLKTQLFGVRAAICFGFLAPVALYSIKLWCLERHLVIDMPDQLIWWIATLNTVSMMGYAFKLRFERPSWFSNWFGSTIKTVNQQDTLPPLNALPEPEDDDGV